RKPRAISTCNCAFSSVFVHRREDSPDADRLALFTVYDWAAADAGRNRAFGQLKEFDDERAEKTMDA
ncbi:hypothetical protein D0N87_31440, partial [Pseudomonas sp. ATCC 13867]